MFSTTPVVPEEEGKVSSVTFAANVLAGATYWAWSTEEWIEVISYSVRVEHYRGDFIGLAYLLCGFSDIYRVGHFFQPKLASKIFGTDIVAQALTTIREELAKVGYGRGRLI
jgi:hypothetical protein